MAKLNDFTMKTTEVYQDNINQVDNPTNPTFCYIECLREREAEKKLLKQNLVQTKSV